MAWNQFSSAEESQDAKSQDNADRFFGAAGRNQPEFVPVGTTVKNHYYFGVLKRLNVRIHHVGNEQFRNNSSLLLYDKAPTYFAVEREAVSCFQIDLCDPASLLLARFGTGRIFLFTKVKWVLNGERFSNISDIQLGVTELLEGI